MSTPHSTPPNKAASTAVPHAIAGANATLIGAVNAIHVAISPIVSQTLVALELALSSHNRGVLISVCSLPLKAVPSSKLCSLCWT